MHTAHPFWTYSNLTLAHQLGADESRKPIHTPGPGIRQKNLQSVLRRLERTERKHLLLLGLGAGTLAADLARQLPPEIGFMLCELDPGHVRRTIVTAPEFLHWWSPQSRHQLLVDLSPWALLLLLACAGPSAQQTLAMLNPELENEQKRNQLRLLQRLFVTAAPWSPTPPAAEQKPSVSAAAILHPGEPDLDAFFQQFPAWLKELVVVWDAAELPEQSKIPVPAGLRLQQIARPLDLDFGAQRNAMLSGCSGEWILYLDADERLAPATWSLLPSLLGPDCPEGFFFPRLTFHPDQAHCMAGLGLWPDLQLRLFKNLPGIRFERTVHERLRGLNGKRGLLLGAPLLHLSHINKDQTVLMKKLELFNKAASQPDLHRLNPEFPHLPVGFFQQLTAQLPPNQMLLVPFAAER